MTRIQADPSDAGGNALLNLRIDGATVGSTGVQQLNNGTAVSTRTLSASYLSAPPNGAALAPGWHTVQLGVNASGSFIHLTAFKDLPLLWFD